MSTATNDTVILGAGIIGLSTAYYLSQSGKTEPESIHLVDSSSRLFHCASGFAGGFLAADWFAPSNASLGALSFALHKSLAEKHDGRKTWGYCPSTSLSLSHDSEAAVGGSGEDWLEHGTSRAQATGSKGAAGREGLGPAWLKRVEEDSLETISREGTVAQIDPYRFCQWLLKRCLEKGVRLHQPARALSVSKDENNHLNGIRISRDGAESELFAADSLGFSPEWFSRAGGELYLAGLNTTMMPLPELATDVKVVDDAIEKMKQCAAEMISEVDGKPMEILRESLCFRPVSTSGRPLVCRVADEKLGREIKTRGGGEGGVFIAAGHGAWGISQAPGTGLVMAELIEGRQTSANVSALVLPS